MIKKQSLWFLTLFSLVLVLGVYYITMPTQILENNKDKIVNKGNRYKKSVSFILEYDKELINYSFPLQTLNSFLPNQHHFRQNKYNYLLL